MHKWIVVLTCWCASALAATAGLNRYVDTPGYVDLGDLRQFESGHAVTEIIIPKTLIRMVAAMVRKEEPQFAEMLKHLELVHVHSIEVKNQQLSAVDEHINTLSDRLDRDGWDVLVRMREDDSQNQIFILPADEDGIRGLCVLFLDGSEAAFVNIVGRIDLEMLSRLGEQFDIPGLDEPDEPAAPGSDEQAAPSSDRPPEGVPDEPPGGEPSAPVEDAP